MSRGLDTRLSKLEARRDMADDDLSRLTAEELDARIDVFRLLIEAQRTGQLAETRARLMADPTTAPILAAMDRRQASPAACKKYAGMTEAQLDERIAQLTASLAAP
jgi:hypothetical protein